jgi:hypothetical protein
MRVKKRIKKRVKKGIKSVKSAPPEAYVAGVGGLVGSAAVLLLTATKSGRELLVRTAQLTRRPEAEKPDSEESDVQEEEVKGVSRLTTPTLKRSQKRAPNDDDESEATQT